MDYAFIAAALQNRWNTWNIRGFLILSLCVHVLLAMFAPQRQWTLYRFVIFVVWSAYFLSDWAPTFAFGLISNARCGNLENNEAQVPPDVLAFWAAFLLDHLGGPDNITAFSMEDNALWMCHLVGLVAQISVIMYILVKTLPNNRLLVPTILVFVTGVINYGERSRAMYLASLENLKKTIKKDIGEEQSDCVHFWHTILKGLIVDIVPDLQECHKSRTFIKCPANMLFPLISDQLNLLYELLYTKIKASNSTWGRIVRAIAYYNTLVAFILFFIGHKHQFHRGDLVITFALFAGVFILHVANVMTLMTTSFSDYSFKDLSLLVLEQGIFPPLLIIGLAYITSINSVDSVCYCITFARQWPNKMGYFNILSHCFKQSTLKKGFTRNKLAGEKHVSWEYIDVSTMLASFSWNWNQLARERHVPLWYYVSQEIKIMADMTMDAARLRELYEARGDRALKQLRCDQLIPYIEGFQFEHTLLIWHIATEICFILSAGEDYVYNEDMMDKRVSSKKLSDYMMYLLVRRPKLMSAVAGISHIRYKDTCAEVKLLGRKKLEDPTMQGFCELILGGRADIEPEIKENNHPFSVLTDSCELVELLKGRNNMWEVLYMVWMELLLYAAGQCRADVHARVLSEGGEFITAIWALMSLSGIGDHFPVNSPSPGLPDGNTSCSNPPAGADASNADRAAPHPLRVQRREEDAEQVTAVDDNNITEDPNYNSVSDCVFVESV